MPFPKTQRVIYSRNPLKQVICQLRFPPILKIDTDIPADFQDRIRNEFPKFEESTKLSFELPKEAKGQIPSEIFSKALQNSGRKNYEFSSEDGFWKVNLTHTFIALSAFSYTRWEEFVEWLEIPLNSLIDIYSPAYFSRIGLRYVDVIRRSSLKLENVEWSELLRPYISGILGSPNVGKHVVNVENKFEVNLADENSIVRIITQFVEAEDDGELCYRIDSDFFNTTKTEIENALSLLDYFNTRGSRLIRWSITDRLHEAMEPQEL